MELVRAAPVSKLADHIEQSGLGVPALADEYRYASLPLCVVDAVFSIGVRYVSTQKVVSNLCDYTGWTRFIHRIAQSENLLPFLLGDHCAPIAIPAERDEDGVWKVYDEAAIRKLGFTQTARRFRQINENLGQVGQKKSLQQRIDERRKLTKQKLADYGFLLLAGAGGKIICAACVPAAQAHDLVIDQTLYWKLIPYENEAWYLVGMLNSRALTEAIAPFNPKGAFSERHVHTLPYRLMPPFDPANEDHLRIASLAKDIAGIAETVVAADETIRSGSWIFAGANCGKSELGTRRPSSLNNFVRRVWGRRWRKLKDDKCCLNIGGGNATETTNA